mmetsp:Transcript_8477/g.9616  ORF Transcript_8477/g.9616 Transcript_8477/m.9616 type:complete len:81 (+) Transcript_8477:895-1137(+)
MNILSSITNMKVNLAKMWESGVYLTDSEIAHWNAISNTCLQAVISDSQILSLIRDSMKLEHITVIKPLLEIIGNLINFTD